MNGKILLISGLCLSTALVTFFPVAPADAGFEWKPPVRQAPKTQAGQASGAVMPEPVTPGLLTPMPGDAVPPPVKNLPVPAAVQPVSESDLSDTAPPVAPVTRTQPATTAPAPTGMKVISQNPQDEEIMWHQGDQTAAPVPAPVGIPVPVPVPAQPVSEAGITQGFGKNIPLAVAVRRIVPSGYLFSFEKSVDQGKPISWAGGHPWKQELDQALAAVRLSESVKDNVISVQNMDMQPAPARIAESKPAAKPVAAAPQEQITWNDAKPVEAPKPVPVPTSVKTEKPAEIAKPVEAPKPVDVKPIDVKPAPKPVKIARPEPVAKPVAAAPQEEITWNDAKPLEAPKPVKTEKPVKIARPVDLKPIVAKPMPVKHAEMNPVKNAKPARAPSVQPEKLAARNTASPVLPDNAMTVDLGATQPWVAQPGQTLHEVLESWGDAAHVTIAWRQDMKDMPISSGFSFNGSFDQAVDALLALYSDEKVAPHGKLYPNLPQGPSVLAVSPE